MLLQICDNYKILICHLSRVRVAKYIVKGSTCKVLALSFVTENVNRSLRAPLTGIPSVDQSAVSQQALQSGENMQDYLVVCVKDSHKKCGCN